MSNYKLQMYTPDLRQQVGALQKHLFGKESSVRLNTAYLDWKHLRNPYLEEPLIYTASFRGYVVGMRAMFGTCWQAGNSADKVVLPSAADAVIDPDHRDSGLFRELTDYVMDDLQGQGYSHVLNLSPSPANYVVSVMTMGWRPIGSSEMMSRYSSQNILGAVDVGASRPNVMHRIAGKTIEVARVAGRQIKTAMRVSAFSALDRNASSLGDAVSLSRKPRPQAMSDLVQQIESDGRLRQVRDPAFFSWRFDNPRFTYRFLFWGGEILDGYMILQNKVGRRQVNIVDWEGRSDQIRAELLEAAIHWGQFKTMGIWGTTQAASVIGTLQDAGFSYVNTDSNSHDGHGGQFMLKPLNLNEKHGNILGRNPLDSKSWDLRMIYSDGE